MNLFDYSTKCDLSCKAEIERAKFLSYYNYKINGQTSFNTADIKELFASCGFNSPNISRLTNNLTKGKNKIFLVSKGNPISYSFIPTVLQFMENSYGNLFSDYESIESDSNFIDENKFCNKRPYLDKLIKQINHCYDNNCYDACAVLLRRLFEILLILTYQNNNIDDEIKDKNGTGYVMLDSIVKNAINNTTLKFTRIKKEFDTFRAIGNYSAHNIFYTAGRKDIDDIKLSYRVMLEELYNKSGII